MGDKLKNNVSFYSKLGGGWAQAGYDPLQDHLSFDDQELNNKLVERFTILEDCSGQSAGYVFLQDGFDAIYHQLFSHDPEDVQYFYHSDHLGSSSFITDASGTVDQHLQYLPFGEPWIDQRTNTGIRFTFSGKEKDEETGYSYFGARYYNADISIWLSLDPLSDEFPSWTGYHYVHNNPLKLIDPTGMSAEEFDGIKGFFQKVGNFVKGDGWIDNDTRESNKNPVLLPEVEVVDQKSANSTNNNYESGEESWYSIYNWPILGSSQRTMDALYDGD
jgi:RHS repeat-associated protein